MEQRRPVERAAGAGARRRSRSPSRAEEPRTEPKPRPKAHKAKAKGHANAAQVREILEARARVDSVRGVLEELTGRSDDADLTCALLDGRIATPARLLLDAADEESESARAIGCWPPGRRTRPRCATPHASRPP